MEILTGLTEGFVTNALYDVAKKILKKDPIRSALDQTIEELTREKQIGWYESRIIDGNQEEIVNNINIIKEATFLKIFIDKGVSPETTLKLYKNFSEKFNGIITWISELSVTMSKDLSLKPTYRACYMLIL